MYVDYFSQITYDFFNIPELTDPLWCDTIKSR
jgi:hypothetical protein